MLKQLKENLDLDENKKADVLWEMNFIYNKIRNRVSYLSRKHKSVANDEISNFYLNEISRLHTIALSLGATEEQIDRLRDHMNNAYGNVDDLIY